jgi:hypothetical protein
MGQTAESPRDLDADFTIAVRGERRQRLAQDRLLESRRR